MMRLISPDVWSFHTLSFAVQEEEPSALNAVRRLRMLRELGCAVDHCPDSAAGSLVVDRDDVLDDALHADEETTDAFSGPLAEAINQAISEMMARVQAEQIAIVEVWARTMKDELSYHVPEKTSHLKRLGKSVADKTSQIPRLIRWRLHTVIHLRHNTGDAATKRFVVPPQRPELPTHRYS
jgi:hypothetical protein